MFWVVFEPQVEGLGATDELIDWLPPFVCLIRKLVKQSGHPHLLFHAKPCAPSVEHAPGQAMAHVVVAGVLFPCLLEPCTNHP